MKPHTPLQRCWPLVLSLAVLPMAGAVWAQTPAGGQVSPSPQGVREPVKDAAKKALNKAEKTAPKKAGPAEPSPEAVIRKTLAERLPQLAKIDEVRRTPIAGLWEVRYSGSEILYTDDKGEFVFVNGSMVDTKTRVDLTEARIEKLLVIAFDKLPLKDAIVVKQGAGTRKVAVFEDPNCGYCKRFERDLTTIKDVTIYTFLLPILGPDSVAKSRDIWCAKDNVAAWRAWMVDNTVPTKVETCDASALERNLAFSRTHRITGTPAVFFEDGTRKPGALPPAAVEQFLVAASAKK
jgi:thiol:disulfide interchange protein DsbC